MVLAVDLPTLSESLNGLAYTEVNFNDWNSVSGNNLRAAKAYLTRRLSEGSLPGLAQGEHGSFDIEKLISTYSCPLYIPYRFRKNDDVEERHHYIVVKNSSAEDWQIARAWRTDEKGKKIEEYKFY